MEDNNESSSSFPIGQTAQEKALPFVPECYKVQHLDKPMKDFKIADVPLINLAGMSDPAWRPVLVEEIANVCRRDCFFQVINHGISEATLDAALSAASGFFSLPAQEKAAFMSNDVHKPVRYGTSLKDGVDKVQFWRVFLKHYSHPLKDWIGLWPDNPPDYRKKLGEYVEAVQEVAQMIMGLITESLGLGPTYLSSKLDEGMQVTAVNCYPPCPQPQLALGLPSHSDYGCLTVVLQDSPGLQILGSYGKTWWKVPVIQGALQVHVGNQMEVFNNGKYKSIVHRVTVNSEKTRISIASLHTLGMDVKMEAAKELVDEEHPKGYRESSFRDFLDFISRLDIGEGRSFLDTLKIKG